MKIGEIAALAGVGVDTIRYYERLGLLPTASRLASGYRVFDGAAVQRIHLVKELQELGLTLDEVGALLAAAERGGSTCPTESARLEVVLRRTDEKLAALTAARDQPKAHSPAALAAGATCSNARAIRTVRVDRRSRCRYGWGHSCHAPRVRASCDRGRRWLTRSTGRRAAPGGPSFTSHGTISSAPRDRPTTTRAKRRRRRRA